MRFRRVMARDCWPLFNWANDPTTRAASFRPGYITEQQHALWFVKRLADPTVCGYVAEQDGEAVAVAWYTKERDHAEASVTVAPAHRGHGYATALLRESAAIAMDALRVNSIRALVFIGNIASVKSFERAGYQTIGRPCWVMEIQQREDSDALDVPLDRGVSREEQVTVGDVRAVQPAA